MRSLNTVFSSRQSRRRYEVWFLRLGLADGRGAWWFRYLLMNPARGGCPGSSAAMPVQVWASWFPKDSKPSTFIQGFPMEQLDLTLKGRYPFQFAVGNNGITENSCRADLEVDGHRVSWDLRYASTFAATLSNKGWIGFSRTPHADATFSGKIALDGETFEGAPLGFGLQGHNCGYRHRNFWTWGHAYFGGKQPSTLEALIYDLPFGMTFRRAILWHGGKRYDLRIVKEQENREQMEWSFKAVAKNGSRIQAKFEGGGPGCHRLPYLKTNCSGSFEVANNSFANAHVTLECDDGLHTLETVGGAVLEMGGKR